MKNGIYSESKNSLKNKYNFIPFANFDATIMTSLLGWRSFVVKVINGIFLISYCLKVNGKKFLDLLLFKS